MLLQEKTKPNRFLYDQAAADLSLGLSRCYTIGDSPQDVEAARSFGGLGCLVRTGWAADGKVVDQTRESAAFIGDTVSDVVDWILSAEQKSRP